MTRTIRSLRTAGAAAIGVMLVALAVTASPAAATVAGELRGGYHNDTESGLLGGGVNAGIGSAWYFNPNAEWLFVDGYDAWSINADFHRDFDVDGPSIWVGAGPAVLVTDVEGNGNSDQDLGLNLLGGIGDKHGAIRPFGQVKVTLADNSSSSMAVGVRF